MTVSREVFKSAMAQLVGGVTIVAAGTGFERRGITATAVCSLSIEPPTLLACINRHSELWSRVTQVGAFSVNILTQAQEQLARVFAGMTLVHGRQRFEHGSWFEGGTGSPLLADCLATFDCQLVGSHSHTTHEIFLGQVLEASVSAGEPLAYAQGSFRTLHPA